MIPFTDLLVLFHVQWIMELAKEVSQIPFVVVGCKQDVRNDCAQSMTVPKDEVYYCNVLDHDFSKRFYFRFTCSLFAD